MSDNVQNTEGQVEAPNVDSMSAEEFDSFLSNTLGISGEVNDVIPTDSEAESKPKYTEQEEVQQEEAPEEQNEPETPETDAEGQEDGETPENSDSEPDTEVDEDAIAKQIYNDLFKEGIKASGKNRTIRDPEHLKTLVRIGLSANENNRKIKPYLRTLKSFENAGFELTPENSNFIMDLLSGDKGAIKELVKRHGYSEDDLEDVIDSESELQYAPNDRMIDEKTYTVQEELERITDSDIYDDFIKEVTNLDDADKQLISDNPSFIGNLHSDMAAGVYDKVMDEVNYLESVGELKQSKLQTYISIVSDNSYFNKVMGEQPKGEQAVETPKQQQQQQQVEDTTRQRKKSVSNTPTTTTSNTQSHYKPTMSDEEVDAFLREVGVEDFE